MFYTLHRHQGIGHPSYFRPSASHHQHLQAMIVIEVHMHAGEDMTLEVVLNVRQLAGEISYVVVIHERDGPHPFTVRAAGPFLTHELITNEIAKRFRAGRIASTPYDFIERVEQMVIQRDAETNELFHDGNYTIIRFVPRHYREGGLTCQDDPGELLGPLLLRPHHLPHA